jgi:hypothetical protein
LIEYDLEIENPHTSSQIITLIGKVRAKGTDISSYQLQQSLWNAGFSDNDELRILYERLPLVAQMYPRWGKRLERVLEACEHVGAATPEPKLRGIHRDFYPDQVIVDGHRLYLLDLDLYCEGDSGLDIGNFIGHITEQSLRTLGSPDALADREVALEERFVELSGEVTRAAVRSYTTLTLVRHIYISTQFAERCPFSEALLELCEQRLETVGRTLAINSFSSA